MPDTQNPQETRVNSVHGFKGFSPWPPDSKAGVVGRHGGTEALTKFMGAWKQSTGTVPERKRCPRS